MPTLTRVAALAVLTAAFAPAAVLGALPFVAPVVGLLLLLLLAIGHESAPPLEPAVMTDPGPTYSP